MWGDPAALYEEGRRDSCCHGRDGVIKTTFFFFFFFFPFCLVVERRRFFFFSLRVAARRRQRSGDNPIELGGEEGYNIHVWQRKKKAAHFTLQFVSFLFFFFFFEAEKEAIVIHHGCRGAYATSIA